MKKLWPHIRSVIFLCVLAAVICVCDYLFAESGYIRFIFNQVKAENADTDTGYDTIVLGASHTRCSIDVSYMDIMSGAHAFNMGIPGETVDDMYYVLKSVCKDNKVKKVIIDVDYYYWMNGQSQNHFSRSFIYQQISDPALKAEYLWKNKEYIDIRNVFSRRLTWKCTLDKAKTNIKLKNTEDYKNYDMSAGLDVDGYFATAGGPYMGKGFCFRYKMNDVPGNPEYIKTMKGNANKELDATVIAQFEQLVSYCRDNDIEIVCVESPITPDAFRDAEVDKAVTKLKSLFDSYGIAYYDFNKTLMSVLPRDDSSYVDTEGHMYGELAESYSEVLAEVLDKAAAGTLNESDYFYDSYESMYNSMVADYENTTGLEWKSY